MEASTTDRDRARVDECCSRLDEDGYLEYTGEYGPEVISFVPFVAWLKKSGRLEGRRILSYKGMRPYYFFLGDGEFAEKDERRSWLKYDKRFWPSSVTHLGEPCPWHLYPDYRARYQNQGLEFPRPLIFVQNKFAVEWGVGPINYIPLNILDRFLEQTRDTYSVVYSRPRGNSSGYSEDSNNFCDFPDQRIIEKYAHVTCLEDLASGREYNSVKLEVLAKTSICITTHGGGSHILAAFPHSLMLIFDNEAADCVSKIGKDYLRTYREGPYTYMADPAPKIWVARDYLTLARAMLVIGSSTPENGMLKIPSKKSLTRKLTNY